MYKKKRILGLIPARGGSKGLPGKNIRPLNGKPLIAWTIQQASQSKYLDRTIISTDDPKIAQIARSCAGDVPFLRPKKLASDRSPTIDTVTHAVEFLKTKGESFDFLALLEPTSPLRARDDLDKAIKILIDQQEKFDCLVSLGQVHLEHPRIMKKMDNGYVASYMPSNAQKVKRRQDLEIVYFPYGVIYLSKIETLLKTGSFYQQKQIPYFIERWQGYEVDDLYDFLCIEAVMRLAIQQGRIV